MICWKYVFVNLNQTLFTNVSTYYFFPEPTTCGKPEQPPNSTLVAPNFNVGTRIEYSCDDGHLLVGPSQRSCLPTGFYSEFPPVCRCKCCMINTLV